MKHYEELCILEREIKQITKIEYDEHNNAVIKLYESNFELLNCLNEKWNIMGDKILINKIIAATSYRIITNSMAALKLVETGYYNESKSILRAILENIETKAFFIIYPNNFIDWTKNKYKMRDIVQKLNLKGELPKSFSNIYRYLSEEGTHAGPKNLINIFTVFENDLISDLPKELILVKDKPRFDFHTADICYYYLMMFMAINLIYDRDYYKGFVPSEILDGLEEFLQQTYELLMKKKRETQPL